MLNIMLTGVGGQGTVLAAKLLAQAAADKGWSVRSAETIGMAQRGGTVTSHVRIGNAGEDVFSPLIAKGSADIIIAFEPAEGARVLPYLKAKGLLVCASSPIQPVTVALSGRSYDPQAVMEETRATMKKAHLRQKLLVVDEAPLTAEFGNRVLNTVLLASALQTGEIPISIDDLRAAIRACVKPQFVDMNLAVIDAVEAR